MLRILSNTDYNIQNSTLAIETYKLYMGLKYRYMYLNTLMFIPMLTISLVVSAQDVAKFKFFRYNPTNIEHRDIVVLQPPTSREGDSLI